MELITIQYLKIIYVVKYCTMIVKYPMYVVCMFILIYNLYSKISILSTNASFMYDSRWFLLIVFVIYIPFKSKNVQFTCK